MSSKFEVLTGRSQILKRPQMWIGSMDNTSQDIFLIKENKVDYSTVSYIPAFKKIIDEILDNSLDALIEHKNASGTITISVESDHIKISDDGTGIPVEKKKLSESEKKNLPKEEAKKLAELYIPQIAWSRLFSGSNFNDSDDKTTIGSHGIGSKATAIFSTKFIGITDDGKKRCTVTSLNNLEKTDCEISKTTKKSGTSVEFWPDFPRFKLEKVDQIYIDLLYQRLLCLSITFPKIKFIFNGKKISVNEKNFLKMFSKDIEFISFDKGFIGICSNEDDDFKYFSYVNGLSLNRGGSHIDYIVNNIVSPIRDKLSKKYKQIKPADIRNKLTVIVFMRDFPNPKFDSQTKETLTNSPSEINTFLKDKINFEAFAKVILKNTNIINPIVDLFKIKEELKAKSELKKAKKVKIKSDKYMPPIGNKKWLALCEGMSARSGISASLGRQGFGYYAMRGVPLNAYSSNIQKIAANQELKEITQILNLDFSTKSDVKKNIEFDNILITSDNDADGSHITSMIIGLFYKYAKNLFDEGKICKLITPLIISKDTKGKIKEYFFNVNEFKSWESKNKDTKLKHTYLKGLGSWEKDDLIYLIDKFGFENFVFQYKLDDKSNVYIEDWLGNDAEKRKEHLRHYSFDINKA